MATHRISKPKTATRRLTAFSLAASAAVAGLSAASAATAAQAKTTATDSATSSASIAAVSNGFYRTPWNGNIYQVKNGVAARLTLNQYLSMGSPRYANAPTEYTKYSWASTIYAVVKWGNNPAGWSVDALSHSQWQSLGSPRTTNAKLVPGTDIFRFGNSSQVFAVSPDGLHHVLTWNEYVWIGMPAPRVIHNQGYKKLAWSDEIGFFTDLANGKGFRISLNQWLRDGAPAAQQVQRLAGDRFAKFSNSDAVTYSGPLVSRRVTFNEWLAAGAPSPVVTQVAVAAAAAAAPSFNSGDPRSIARSMLSSYGWSDSQFGCLESLWEKESGWNSRAYNPSSGATGIPQALPGSKMASAGGDWRTNPATQIRWGLTYIQGRYGSPCNAWGHSVANNWY